MPIKMEFSDAVKAASNKVLGAGPSVAQANQAAVQLNASIAALQAAHAQTVRDITGKEPPAPNLDEFDVTRAGGVMDLMGDDLTPTRDSARAAMHATLDKIMDELEQDPLYVGLQIDEHRFANKGNQIACINFVPIDLIGGTPARRINNPV